MDLDAAPQGGARYPVTASLAGRVFTRCRLDVGVGDAVVPPTELIEGRDWLGFAGIAPLQLMAISKEQQFAEKLHAYTLPRPDTPNSRVKDLVDMVLLIRMGTMDKAVLRRAIETTFELRRTHAIPTNVPEEHIGNKMAVLFPIVSIASFLNPQGLGKKPAICDVKRKP